MMYTHLISSWEIMPQALVVCFGDVNFFIDGTGVLLVAFMAAATWLIRTRR